MTLRQLLAELQLGCQRSVRCDTPQTVANTMYVDVDADRRYVVSNGKHQVGGLAANPRQLQQPFQGVRYPGGVVATQEYAYPL